MPQKTLRILFVADIVGQPGLDLITTFLPSLIEKHNADFVIANGENSHEGKGINEAIVNLLYEHGVDVITGGNHTFDKWKIFEYMKTDKNLLRPLNYPRGAHGYGFGVYSPKNVDCKVGVLNLQGRTFMNAIDDPFRSADWAIEKISNETNIIFVDFHAEATAEKQALGWYLDGKISVLVGTHTHIPTADARLLTNGTGYMTDVGMTGSFNSVIGMNKETAIKRFLLGTPHRYSLAKGDSHLCAVLADVDIETGKCQNIEPIVFPEFVHSK